MCWLLKSALTLAIIIHLPVAALLLYWDVSQHLSFRVLALPWKALTSIFLVLSLMSLKQSLHTMNIATNMSSFSALVACSGKGLSPRLEQVSHVSVTSSLWKCYFSLQFLSWGMASHSSCFQGLYIFNRLIPHSVLSSWFVVFSENAIFPHSFLCPPGSTWLFGYLLPRLFGLFHKGAAGPTYWI